MIVVLSIIFMANKFGVATSDTELQNTLDKAVEHALYTATSNNIYTINDEEEFAADVMHELLSSCNTKADYTIVFKEIDLENGLVDIQVTQKLKSPLYVGSEVVCRRTIILDTVMEGIS